MGSKSKRRHAQKQYNRAQNKPAVSEIANATAVENSTAVASEQPAVTSIPVVMTPKEFRQAEKERAKQAKLAQKEQAKKAAEKNKNKKDKEKKPFFLVRFFKWLWRSLSSVFSELKKVHWPTLKQVLKATGVVLGIVALFGVVLLVVCILFGLLHYLLVNGSLSGWTVF